MEIVGLIPAAGIASRLGKLPSSKELLPVRDDSGKVKVVSENLIHYYRIAGIKEIFIVIRQGKWDIPEYYGDGAEFGVHIGYLMMRHPYGTPFTLNQAYPFVKDKMVAMGFPDIIFKPEDAFKQLISRISENDADIMLGIVPHKKAIKSDMVEFNENGSIRDIVIKQDRWDLKYSWFITVWKPRFTQFLKDFVDDCLNRDVTKIRMQDGSWREIFIGDVILHAIKKGFKTDYIVFENSNYKDIGTPDDLKNLLQ